MSLMRIRPKRAPFSLFYNFTIFTCNLNLAFRLARDIKKINPGCRNLQMATREIGYEFV